MPVIALANQKGGSSKSTTSVHFAYWLLQQGKEVALIDADAQRSSSLWMERMESPITVHVLSSSDELLEKIPEISAEHAYVVVDGPAGLSEATRAILFRADFALVPCQPTGLDLRSAADAFRVVHQAQSVRNGPPIAYAFISRAVKGTRLKQEAISLLNKTGVPSLQTAIHQRQVVADCFGQSATDWDMTGKSAVEAASEYENLFREVMEELP